jgi:hypothetical protein
MATDQRHFSEKLFIFPESFHALRIELQTYYPNLWNTPIQYLLWADQAGFVEKMTEALSMVIRDFDSANLDGYCKQFLDELRERRGVSRLHPPSEYYPDPLRNSADSIGK